MALEQLMGGLGFGNVGAWFATIFFWLMIGAGFFIFVIVCLYIRKRRKLIYKVLEVTDLGGGKAGYRNTKAGWFKSQTMFFGLIEKGGEERLRLKDGREVQNASSSDFHDIDGSRGLVVQRKPDDPKVLLPISKTELIKKVNLMDKGTVNSIKKITLDKESLEILNTIAPAEFRDTSSKIMQKAEEETLSKFNQFIQQFMPFIMMGVFIIALIFIIQYAKHTQAEAWKFTEEAIKLKYENLKTSQAIASSVAPFLLFFKRKWFK